MRPCRSTDTPNGHTKKDATKSLFHPKPTPPTTAPLALLPLLNAGVTSSYHTLPASLNLSHAFSAAPVSLHPSVPGELSERSWFIQRTN